jgi:hypothetical protein
MRNSLVIATLVLLMVPFVAFGKHPAPPQVGAVTNNGVRYVVPNDNGLRAYVEAWDIQTGKKLWAKTVVRHYYIPPFGTECTHFEYLKEMRLQGDTLILTSDRGRTFSLDTRTRAVRRVKTEEPKKPGGGGAKAGLSVPCCGRGFAGLQLLRGPVLGRCA